MKSILMRSRLFIVLVACIALSGAAALAKQSDSEFRKFRKHFLILEDGKPALSRETCKPIHFVFVNNQSPAGGNGTFEFPYNTLAAAQINSSPNDIIYVLVGDGSDMGQNAGIILQYGQQLLGAGICQSLKTKEGKVTIPAQSPAGLPTISNANVTDPTGLAAVRLRDGHNVVSGLNIVDKLGVFISLSPLIISSAIQIDTGTQYTIKNNTLSSTDNSSTNPLAIGGGEVGTILGGGCMKFTNNIIASANAGDVYGLVFENYGSLFTGSIEVTKNVFRGLNSTSGFVQAFHYDNSDQFPILQTTSSLSLVNNIFASQFNSTPPSVDTVIGIEIVSAPAEYNTVTFDITGNVITLPMGVPANASSPVAGLLLGGFGPGATVVKVHKNAAINSYGVPDYFFLNLSSPFSPSALKVCFSDNIGTRQDLIEAGREFHLGGSKGRHFRNARATASNKVK